MIRLRPFRSARGGLLLLLAVVLLTTIPFYLWPLDITVSRLFYRPDNPGNPWPRGEDALSLFFYTLASFLAWVPGFVALGVLVASRWWVWLRRWRIYALFVVLGITIGPGLLVNTVFKDHWGRPRPKHIVAFGGHHTYQPPGVKGPSGEGKSFPCGHSSVGFALTAGYFILRRRHPAAGRAVLAGSLGLGTAMGLGRVADGAHFASDVLWSAYIPVLTNYVLYYFVLRIPEREDVGEVEAAVFRSRRWELPACLAAAGVVAAAGLFAHPVRYVYSWSADSSGVTPLPPKVHIHADRTRVVILENPAQTAPVTISGTAQGFGVPGHRIQLHQGMPADKRDLDLSLVTTGVFTELDSTMTVRLQPQSCPQVELDVEPGSVYIAAEALGALRRCFPAGVPGTAAVRSQR